MKEINQLLQMMARLRDPENGCPWDTEQSFSSIAPYTIEEAYEVADAASRGNMEDLKVELGDLLFQVVFHAQMAEEKGAFDFFDVATAVTQKMIKRHPHVFDPNHPKLTSEQQNRLCEAEKNKQKQSVVDDIPVNMPEMLRSTKLTKAAASIGFDWPEVSQVFEKIDEEVIELKEAIENGSSEEVLDELGDLLFVCTNIARHLNVDPGSALRHANSKFERRFRAVEQLAQKKFPEQKSYDLDDLEVFWNSVKKNTENRAELNTTDKS